MAGAVGEVVVEGIGEAEAIGEAKIGEAAMAGPEPPPTPATPTRKVEVASHQGRDHPGTTPNLQKAVVTAIMPMGRRLTIVPNQPPVLG